MDFETVVGIIGAGAVTDIENLVKAAHARLQDQSDGETALVELLLAMVAAVLVSERDKPEFRSRVDEIAERLRSVCIEVHDAGPHVTHLLGIIGR